MLHAAENIPQGTDILKRRRELCLEGVVASNLTTCALLNGCAEVLARSIHWCLICNVDLVDFHFCQGVRLRERQDLGMDLAGVMPV